MQRIVIACHATHRYTICICAMTQGEVWQDVTHSEVPQDTQPVYNNFIPGLDGQRTLQHSLH
jgi:hypothetical protein